MSKKHFIAFAQDIKENLIKNDIGSQDLARAKFNMICRIAKKFNLKFNETKFRDACGL